MIVRMCWRCEVAVVADDGENSDGLVRELVLVWAGLDLVGQP